MALYKPHLAPEVKPRLFLTEPYWVYIMELEDLPKVITEMLEAQLAGHLPGR